MATSSSTTFDKALKDVFIDMDTELNASSDPIAEMFLEKEADPEWSGDGRRAIGYVNMSGNTAYGAGGERGQFPAPKNISPQNYIISMKSEYGSLAFAEHVLNAAKKGAGAFKNVMNAELDALSTHIARSKGRQMWGTGRGVICQVNGALAIGATTVVVDNPGLETSPIGGTKWIYDNQDIAFYDAAGVFLTTATVITIIDQVNGTSFSITPALAVAVPDNGLITTTNSLAPSGAESRGLDNEFLGMGAFCDDGTRVLTFQGLSRTTFPKLKSYVRTAAGVLTSAIIQNGFTTTQQRTGKNNIDYLLCDRYVEEAIAALSVSLVRLTGDSMVGNPDAGANTVTRKQGLTFGGVKVVSSYNAPYGQLIGTPKSGIKKFVLREWSPLTRDGSAMRMGISNGAYINEWNQFFFAEKNYAHMTPWEMFRIEGITTAALYVVRN